jgi:hypothetical protein
MIHGLWFFNFGLSREGVGIQAAKKKTAQTHGLVSPIRLPVGAWNSELEQCQHQISERHCSAVPRWKPKFQPELNQDASQLTLNFLTWPSEASTVHQFTITKGNGKEKSAPAKTPWFFRPCTPRVPQFCVSGELGELGEL